MTLSKLAKDDQLARFAAGAMLVGLFNGSKEIEDVRYERLHITFSHPQGTDRQRFVANVKDIMFQDMGKDHEVTHFGVFTATGELYALFPLQRGRKFSADDNPIFREGQLKIGIRDSKDKEF